MWPLGRWRRTGSSGELGRRGEKLAAKALKRAGMKILARNYRCPAGEADLIALDRSTRRQSGAETIVFAEVKTRSSDTYTDPELFLNGFDFISGNGSGDMNFQLSATYEMM